MGSAMSEAGRARAAAQRTAAAPRTIAPRRTAAAILIVAMLVAVIAAGFGCARDNRAFPQLMDSLPRTVGDFTYCDIKSVNSDTDLWDIFDAFEASADARQVEDLIQVIADVHVYARAVSYDNAALAGPATVFRGDLDMAYLRLQMENRGYTRSANKSAEVWLPQENSTYTDAVGIRDSALYLGDSTDVIACISAAASGDALSLWDDPNLKTVADKLPNGIVVSVHRAAAGHGESYTGLVAYGKSYGKANRDALNVKAVYLFGHDPAARAAQLAIEDHSRSLFDDVTIKTEGNLVVVTARVPITRFAASLEF